MPIYTLSTRSKDTLDDPRGDYTTLSLRSLHREEPTRILSDFSGGTACIWNGYAGQGEDFDVFEGSGPNEVLLQAEGRTERYKLTADLGINKGKWLVFCRNGEHHFKIL